MDNFKVGNARCFIIQSLWVECKVCLSHAGGLRWQNLVLVIVQTTKLRDGPLEKLWGGGGGENFRAAWIFFFNVSLEWIFFFVKMLCTNFFPWSNTKLKNINSLSCSLSEGHNLNIGYQGTYAKVSWYII